MKLLAYHLKIPVNAKAALKWLLWYYALSRLLILMTSIQAVSWPEELSIGTMARELLQGTKVPFWDFQLDSYSGEQLVLGIFVVPAFALLGQSIMALKIPTLLISLITLALTAVFVRNYFGMKAAVGAVFFLTFCPPVFLSHFLMVQSGHSEALLLCVLMLTAFYAYFFSSRKKIFLYGFGLAAGFGCWFFYGNVITVLSCLIVWFLLEPKTFFSRDLFRAGASFVIGFSPWGWGLSVHGLASLTDLSGFMPGQGGGILEVFQRLKDILCYALPKSFVFLSRDSSLRVPTAYLYYLACLLFLTAFCAERYKSRRAETALNRKLLFFLVYPAVFLGIYSVSNIPIPYKYDFLITFRYFTPLLFFGFILIGIGAAKSRYAIFALIPLVFLGVTASSRLYFKGDSGSGFEFKGYSYGRLAIDWVGKLDPDQEIFSQIDRHSSYFRPRDRKFFVYQMLRQASYNYPSAKIDVSSLARISEDYRPLYAAHIPAFKAAAGVTDVMKEQISKQISTELLPYFYRGMLVQTGYYESEWIQEFMENPDLLASVPEEYKHFIYVGMGKFQLPPADPAGEESALTGDVLGQKGLFNEWYYRGIGSGVLDGAWPNLFIYSEFLDYVETQKIDVPEKYRDDYYWGVGWQIARRYKRDRDRIDFWISKLPEKRFEAAREGAQSYAKWYGFTRE